MKAKISPPCIVCLLLVLTLLGSTFLSSSTSCLSTLSLYSVSRAQGPIVQGSITYQGDQRVLNLWGSHYEMGYAHGYLLASEIVEMIEKYVIEERDENNPSLDLLT